MSLVWISVNQYFSHKFSCSEFIGSNFATFSSKSVRSDLVFYVISHCPRLAYWSLSPLAFSAISVTHQGSLYFCIDCWSLFIFLWFICLSNVPLLLTLWLCNKHEHLLGQVLTLLFSAILGLLGEGGLGALGLPSLYLYFSLYFDLAFPYSFLYWAFSQIIFYLTFLLILSRRKWTMVCVRPYL